MATSGAKCPNLDFSFHNLNLSNYFTTKIISLKHSLKTHHINTICFKNMQHTWKRWTCLRHMEHLNSMILKPYPSTTTKHYRTKQFLMSTPHARGVNSFLNLRPFTALMTIYFPVKLEGKNRGVSNHTLNE